MVPLGAVGRAQFARRGPAGFGQAAKRAVSLLRAFEYCGRDVPSDVVLLASSRDVLAGPLQRYFHVGQSSSCQNLRLSSWPSSLGYLMFQRLRFRGSPPLREKQSLQVRRIPENAGPLHSFRSLRAGLHVARRFQRARRFRIEVDF